jgi:DHA1 family multidrug resistance protein-like MFS transporter
LERGFVYVCLIRFLMSLSWTMINILLVIYATTFEVPTLLGTLWTVVGLSRFLTETPGGLLVDKVGSKPVIIGGLAVIGASYLLFASAQTPTDMLISSALAGAGFVISAIGLMVQAAYYTPPDERVRYMGIINGSTMASNIVGPTIGGFIADYFGLRISFIASSITAFIALLIALMTREIEAKGSGRKVRGMLHDYRIFMTKRLYLALFFVSFLLSLVSWGFRSMVLPTYGTDVLSLNITQIGLLSSATSTTLFLVQFFLSGIMERFSRRLLVTLRLLICSLAIYSYTATSELYGLAAISAVLGIGLGIITPSLEAIWIDITKAEERERVYGIRIAFFDFGQISWSTILTVVASIGSYMPLYTASAVALVNALILFLVLGNSS